MLDRTHVSYIYVTVTAAIGRALHTEYFMLRSISYEALGVLLTHLIAITICKDQLAGLVELELLPAEATRQSNQCF